MSRKSREGHFLQRPLGLQTAWGWGPCQALGLYQRQRQNQQETNGSLSIFGRGPSHFLVMILKSSCLKEDSPNCFSFSTYKSEMPLTRS